MTTLINKNVLRLEVTMDDTRRVQALDTVDELSGVEAGAVMPQAPPALYLRPKVAARMEVLAQHGRSSRRGRIYTRHNGRTMAKYRWFSS